VRKFQHVETPLRIFAGPDSLLTINRELARLGASRAVILCGASLGRSPLLDLVRAGAGDRLAGVYAAVRTHTPHTGVLDAAEALRRLNADAVIALGGGSAVVTARAASIYLAEGADLDAMATWRDDQGRSHSPRLEAPKIPQLIVPSTPNTAIVKAGSAVFDEAAGRRKALFDHKTRAQAVFLHPDLLMSAPPQLVLSASYDTLALAVEGLLSKSGDALSDASLMHATRLLLDLLPKVATPEDDADLRAELTMAAILAARGTDYTGAGATTVLGHAIGANHDVENGVAKTVVMQHVLRYNAEHAKRGLAKLATALGVSSADPVEPVIASINALFRTLRTPQTLRDLGIPRDALESIALRGMEDWFLTTNPRPIIDASQLMDILSAAW
jgi:alcohol dehydrogenase class IV